MNFIKMVFFGQYLLQFIKKPGNTTAQKELIYRCFLPDLTGFEKPFLHRPRDGERGIRTLGTISGTHDFQSCTFDHSDISPKIRNAFTVQSFLRHKTERGGFEPPVPCGTTVFETARFDRSRISPKIKKPVEIFSRLLTRLGGFELPTFRSAI